MSTAIFGLGKMGTTIAYAMKSLGHRLTLVDTNKSVLDSIDTMLQRLWLKHV